MTNDLQLKNIPPNVCDDVIDGSVFAMARNEMMCECDTFESMSVSVNKSLKPLTINQLMYRGVSSGSRRCIRIRSRSTVSWTRGIHTYIC